tara:strand:- start:10958 stop:11176 length:219 start_codon:yes stop_codon:yes gene_type:complete
MENKQLTFNENVIKQLNKYLTNMEYINSELNALWDRVDDLKESISNISGEVEYVSDKMQKKITDLKEVKDDN